MISCPFYFGSISKYAPLHFEEILYEMKTMRTSRMLGSCRRQGRCLHELLRSPETCDLTRIYSQTCPADLEDALPRSESSRTWWASTVIPFGANLALLVHGPEAQKGPLYVRAYWNEQAIPLPACRSTIDCPLPQFLVGPLTCPKE